MSFKAEVITDSSGQWSSNMLRFGTEAEAQSYGDDLYSRWTLVREVRVVPSDEPVNAEWANGRLHHQPKG
jgi:hypothetical protein